MDEGGGSHVGKCTGDSVDEIKPAASRKRVRSSSSDIGPSSNFPDSEHVFKKRSLSDMDVTTTAEGGLDKVALLDAGSQFGKVRWL